MRDALKDFVDTNRSEFDSLVPGELWTAISSGIEPSITLAKQSGSSKVAGLKKITTMIKYGFGASMLIAGTILLVNSQKEKDNSAQSNAPVVIDSARLFSTPKLNAGAALLNSVKREEEQEEAAIEETQKDSVPEVAEVIVPLDTVPAELPSFQTAPRVNYALTDTKTAMDSMAQADVDTLFNGIKRVELSTSSCHVNIRAVAGDKVRLKGKIEPMSGRVIIMGRRAIIKTEYKLRYVKKDTVLVVYMDEIKVNKHVSGWKCDTKNSVIDLEVPVRTSISADNSTGQLYAKGLEHPNIVLRTTFGNIKAEDIVSDLVANSSSGNLSLTRITGNLKSTTTFGHQHLQSITGNVKLCSSSGKITVKDLKGNAEVSSSFGGQKFEDVRGNITTNLSSGSLTIKNLKGNINSVSSFGTQHFEAVEGDINSKASSGGIHLVNVKGMLTLNTSFGSINGTEVMLLTAGSFKTSSGNIHMAFLNGAEDLSFDLTSSSGKLLVDRGNNKNTAEDALQIKKGSVLVKGVSSFGNQVYK